MKNIKNVFLSVFTLVLILGIGYSFAADEVLERDDNRVPVMGAVTNDANLEVRNVRVDPTSNALLVTTSTTAPSSVTYTDGRATVTAAGTAVAISGTSSTFIECDFQAEENNTGDMVIGGSTVVASLATRRGILLTPGTSFRMGLPGDLDAIYIDSEVNGDGVHYLCQS